MGFGPEINLLLLVRKGLVEVWVADVGMKQHGCKPPPTPAFPPAGPWEAYVVFVLWLPFIFRLLILAKPMRQVINKLPHTPGSFRWSVIPLSWKNAAETCR